MSPSQSSPPSVAPARKVGNVPKGTDLAVRARHKDKLTKRERQLISCILEQRSGCFSVKFVLGKSHMTACIYTRDPQPARRAAVSADAAPARERTVRLQEPEEPERDGTYTTVRPKRKVPPRPAPAAVAKPEVKPKPKPPKVDKNALSARTGGGGKGGGTGSYVGRRGEVVASADVPASLSGAHHLIAPA